MDSFKKHEIFELETLEKLKNNKFLEPLVFGGGTMLRLCYDLNRYSADLDFWFIKKADQNKYYKNLYSFLKKEFDLTDAKIKHYTLLYEIRSRNYPRRLKIEIRKEMKECDFQEKIAFSKFSTKQVLLKVHTLEQTMENKLEAATERNEIRDCFDMEFLLRQGVKLPARNDKLEKLKYVIESYKEKDFRVTLGSVLDVSIRAYYAKNRFDYLIMKINAQMSDSSEVI